MHFYFSIRTQILLIFSVENKLLLEKCHIANDRVQKMALSGRIQEGPSDLPLKQILRPSCERCPLYTWQKETSLSLKTEEDTKRNVNK